MNADKIGYRIDHLPTRREFIGETTNNVILVEDLFNLAIKSQTSFKVKAVGCDIEAVIPYNVLKDCVLVVYN